MKVKAQTKDSIDDILSIQQILEKEMAMTPVFQLGKFQGQRILMGYSPWGCRESDCTDLSGKHYKYNNYCFTFRTKGKATLAFRK